MALDPINDPLDYFLERDRKKRVPDMMSRVETFDLGERPLVVPSTVRPPEYFLDEQAAVQERPVIDLTGPREIRQNDPAIGTEVMARVVPDLTQPREESDRIYSQNVQAGDEADLLSRYAPGSSDAAPQIDLTQPREMTQASPDLAPVYTDPIEAQRARIRSLQQTNHPDYQDNDKGWKRRIGSILREALIGMGDAWNQNAGIGDPTQRLLASVGGGVAGGFSGGFDKRVDERRKQSFDLRREQDALAELERQRALDQQTALRDAQIADVTARPILKAEDLERKREKDAADRVLKERTQTWKEADRVEYFRLEREKLAALNEKRYNDYELAVRRQTEIERANKAREDQQKSNEQGRNERAKQSNNRQQLALKAKSIADQLKAAMDGGYDEEADRLRDELQSIRDQLGSK
ncbi:MAG: hypothetical protein KF855_03465 [Acidobacteria bacterium]|nr:hypothetical protein [Acidobacteriota bacterium]